MPTPTAWPSGWPTRRSISVHRKPPNPIWTRTRSWRRRPQTGADAIHPGYGFLAESAGFADAVASAGLIFVGPSGDTIRLMGDKAAARAQAMQGRRPHRARLRRVITDMEAARAACRGYRLSGDDQGVRRRRRTRHPRRRDGRRVRKLAPQASSEAKAAFGDGGIYLEKVIERARHIEVQVLGDGEDVVHFFERECSLQRRRQKVWEEAPSAALSEEVREELCASAVSLAKSVGYKGAGTVEYLYDDKTGDILLHRDEHPHSGRTSGDGDDLRYRARRTHDRDRRRSASGASPGGRPSVRPRDRGSTERRGSGAELHAVPGDDRLH